MYSQSVPALLSKNVGNSLTNYKTWGGVIVNVKEYGAKGDGVTDDTASIEAALAELSGTTRKFLFFPTGTFLINANRDVVIPINVHLFALERGATLKLNQANTRLKWQSNALSEGTYSAYWPYMNGGITNIKVTGSGSRTVNTLIYVSKMIGTRFINCQFTNAQKLVHIQNKDTLFTEKNTFIECDFDNGTTHVHFDGNVSGGGAADGSFAYSTINECFFSLGETTSEEIGIYLSGGATLYGGNIHAKGHIRKQASGTASRLIKLNASSMNQMNFNVKGESFGEATYVIDLISSTFNYNTGCINMANPDFIMSASGATINGNTVFVTGTALKNRAGTTIFQGDQIPSILVDDLEKRYPARSKTLHMQRQGALTTVDKNNFIGQLPASHYNYHIIRIEVAVGTPGSGNPDGKWYFDIRKNFDPSGFQKMGLTSIYIADGSYSQVIDCDIQQTDSTWYVNPSIFLSTDAVGKNTGTPPTDVYVTITIA